MEEQYMTGKEIINLIQKLKQLGMNAEQILDIIVYVETATPVPMPQS